MADKIQLDETELWQIESKIMEYTYDVKVSLPKVAPPEKGFPVYYLLDGHAYFQFGRDVVKLQSRNAPKTFISPAIVIGIGHHGVNEEVNERRFYEFTPPAAQYIYPERLKGRDIGIHGGAERFLAFLEQELMPVVTQKYQVDVEKQALFGHSLGGLFVLWTLFKRPDLFQYYLASSPSIWWNDHELFTYAEQYYKNAVTHENRKLLITVGSEETFMVDDANQLFISLQSMEQLEVKLYIAPEENHASVVPTIMSRAFRYINT
ncbi:MULTISPECIES: alpha/beta hydrolase [unclassified Peribacillus]|uniref:alpha/beta hydrolase n=1 Tax=unclassified Peribacillus TaxID=2675266 RepID=UPI001F5BB74C|nr:MULTISPECIES: alpha/beta hydrolase-fold protein [unclassified Peribacillus]WMX54755.1 alpha/beta hydrolase-fold protein [Peribacillus sp. R9-11]